MPLTVSAIVLEEGTATSVAEAPNARSGKVGWAAATDSTVPVPSRNFRRDIRRLLMGSSANLRIIIAATSMDRAFLDELRRIVGSEGLLADPLEVLTYECDALPHLRQT